MDLILGRMTEIKESDIAAYLGCPVDNGNRETVEGCANLARDMIVPRVVYRFMDVVDGTLPRFPLPGGDMKKYLEGYNKAVMMIATIGPDPDNTVNRLREEDPAKAKVFEAVCRAALKNIVDNYEEDLKMYLGNEGKKVASRLMFEGSDVPKSIEESFVHFMDAWKRANIEFKNGKVIPEFTCGGVSAIME